MRHVLVARMYVQQALIYSLGRRVLGRRGPH
jgi:hypothetical protein